MHISTGYLGIFFQTLKKTPSPPSPSPYHNLPFSANNLPLSRNNLPLSRNNLPLSRNNGRLSPHAQRGFPLCTHLCVTKNLHDSHEWWSASDNFCIYLTKKTVHSTERESFNYVLTFSFQNLANLPADEVKNHFLLLLMLRI